MTADEFDDVWYAAAIKICQDLKDRNMCRCTEGSCRAKRVMPDGTDYVKHNASGRT